MDPTFVSDQAEPGSNSSKDLTVLTGLTDCDIMRSLYHNVCCNHNEEQSAEEKKQKVITSPNRASELKSDRVHLKHTFKPLDTSRSIRLLRIFDVCFKAKKIKAYFLEHDLDSSAEWEYEALSYTWATPLVGLELKDPETPWTILICELSNPLHASSISMQPNLADFLVAAVSKIQRGNTNLLLEFWIDAICIDQENATEKQVQIALMGDIYANAKRVYIWLGKDKKSWEPFKWVHKVLLPQLIEMSETDFAILRAHDPMDSAFWEKHFPSLKPLSSDWWTVWGCYWRFPLERIWFQRVWTYQEALLARDACFFIGEDLDWMPFSTVVRLFILLESIDWRDPLSAHFWTPTLHQAHHPSRDLLYLYSQQINVGKYISRKSKAPPTGGQTIDPQSWVRTWSSLFPSVRSRSCFLEPDKVNATFGIANLMRPAVIPESIFHETKGFHSKQISHWMTSVFLRHGTDLDELSMVGPSSFNRKRGIPSWVVDYTEDITWCVLTSSEENFDASLTRKEDGGNHVKVDDNTLKTTGIRICTTKELIPVDIQSFPEQCLLLCWGMRETPEYTPTKEHFGDALWKTLVYDNPSLLPNHRKVGLGDFKAWIESAYITKWLFIPYRFPTQSTEIRHDTIKYLEHTVTELATNGIIEFNVRGMLETWRSIFRHPQWESVRQQFAARYEPENPFSCFTTLIHCCSAIPELQKVAHCYQRGAFAELILSTWCGREFFTTDSGHIGMCHEQCVHPGDEIWILKGGRIPYVLRPVEGESGTYGFVGDCYVHGLMRGEYVKRMEEQSSNEGVEPTSQWEEINLV